MKFRRFSVEKIGRGQLHGPCADFDNLAKFNIRLLRHGQRPELTDQGLLLLLTVLWPRRGSCGRRPATPDYTGLLAVAPTVGSAGNGVLRP